MSRVGLISIALGMAFALPTSTAALGSPRALITPFLFSQASAVASTALSGTWRSAPDELPLTTAFDESVWGKNAKSVRTVEMVVRPAGDATLTVTRRVVDARGRTVPGSTSIEHANLILGAVESRNQVRSEVAAAVKSAERRYPDDPQGTWGLEGVRVEVATFNDKPGEIEVRVDFPEGRGSFWETLRRATRGSEQRPRDSK